ncbi:hypothetical protein RKD37_006937 [Streptomyces ambofaciens]
MVIAPSSGARTRPAQQVDARGADEGGDEDVAGQGVDGAGGVDLLEDAAAQDGDAVAQRHGLGLVVGDVDRGDAQLPGQPGDLGAQVVAELGVEVGQRLVHQEGGGVAGDGPAHRHPLAFTAGELGGEAVEEVLDAQHAGGGVHAGAGVGLRVLDAQRETDVPAGGHVGVQGEVLEDHRHAPFGGEQVVGVRAVQHQLALGDLLQSGDHAQHGRLAAAGGAEQDEELARRDVQRQPVHHADASRVGLAHVVQGDGACHGGAPGGSLGSGAPRSDALVRVVRGV